MAVSDYIGRKIDLLVFQGVDGTPYTPLTEALTKPGEPGLVCTGLQKLAQRFLLELLTKKGTILYMPERGSNFLIELEGNTRSITELSGIFERAVTDIGINLVSEETQTDPGSEQFAGAELNSVNVEEDRISFEITLISEAGDSQSLILPIELSS